MASDLNALFYGSSFWRRLRVEALMRDHSRCAAPGCRDQAIFVDHIETRPQTKFPCPLDRLDNLRCLCATHDAQIKERADGTRRGGGAFRARKGVTVDGWPDDTGRDRQG